MKIVLVSSMCCLSIILQLCALQSQSTDSYKHHNQHCDNIQCKYIHLTCSNKHKNKQIFIVENIIQSNSYINY